MASHVQHVTRKVITRRPLDIDPKVKAVAAVAAITIAVVTTVVAVTVLTGGKVDLVAAAGATGPLLLALLAGYLKRSSHAELIEQGVHIADQIARQAEPVVEQLVPSISVEARQVEAGIDAIEAALEAAPKAVSA